MDGQKKAAFSVCPRVLLATAIQVASLFLMMDWPLVNWMTMFHSVVWDRLLHHMRGVAAISFCGTVQIRDRRGLSVLFCQVWKSGTALREATTTKEDGIVLVTLLRWW